MRLLSSLLCFILLKIKLANSTSLHTSLLSRKESPSAQLNNAHGHAEHDSVALFDDTLRASMLAVRRAEARDGVTTSASHEDVHTSLTLLESLASNLDHWGAQDSGSDPRTLDHLLNSRESISAFHRHRAQSGAYLGKSGARLTILLLVVALLITCLSVVCACFGRWWDDEDEMKPPDPTLAAVEYCNGPWARAYRESEGQRRAAIEMLFKCNIITMPEFANYGVSGPHSNIDKCVEIGVSMLEERSISQWEARWQEAQQNFEKKAAEGR